MTFDTFDRNYLRLTLEIDKHIDGYVDAYTGPADLREDVAAAEQRPPQALLDDVAWLQENVPRDDANRAAYLTAALRAIECTLRLLTGAEIPYLEEVQRLYDVTPQRVDEGRFVEAHAMLEKLLPGSGNLAQRMEARRSHYYLPKEKVLPLLEMAREEARQRTADRVDLSADNGVAITLTSDQPWGAYNWYKGNGRSHIEFNTDTPISALGLIGTFAHEGYPGHHTEGLLKEKKFVQERGYGEMAVMLLHSPAAVISEGIATTAVEIIFPDESHHAWNHDVLLPEADILPLETAVELRRMSDALKALRYVSGNAAILYHSGELSKEETIRYIQMYALATPERAAKSFSFLSHPLFRSYLFTYTQGYDLIAAAADGDKWPVFARCLTGQVLPSQLAEEGKEA